MRTIKKILSFVMYTVLSMAMLLAVTVREFVFGPLRLKIASLLLCILYILTFLYNKKAFAILVILLLAGSAAIAFMLVKQQPEKEESSNIFKQCQNIFSGMSESEAKKEYRKLMKEYHPDNAATGDAKKAVEIQKEYENYKNGL